MGDEPSTPGEEICGGSPYGCLGLQDAEMLGQVPGKKGVVVDGVGENMFQHLE